VWERGERHEIRSGKYVNISKAIIRWSASHRITSLYPIYNKPSTPLISKAES
jgi:hypothetical protein